MGQTTKIYNLESLLFLNLMQIFLLVMVLKFGVESVYQIRKYLSKLKNFHCTFFDLAMAFNYTYYSKMGHKLLDARGLYVQDHYGRRPVWRWCMPTLKEFQNFDISYCIALI